MTKITKKVNIIGTMEERMVDKEVSIKDLYERLIALETRMDVKVTTDAVTTRQFRTFVYIIIAIELINFAFNYLVLKNHGLILNLLQ